MRGRAGCWQAGASTIGGLNSGSGGGAANPTIPPGWSIKDTRPLVLGSVLLDHITQGILGWHGLNVETSGGTCCFEVQSYNGGCQHECLRERSRGRNLVPSHSSADEYPFRVCADTGEHAAMTWRATFESVPDDGVTVWVRCYWLRQPPVQAVWSLAGQAWTVTVGDESGASHNLTVPWWVCGWWRPT
jgi:hypothetical protein